jgi:hypothetical protein
MRLEPELLRALLLHVEEHATRAHVELDDIAIDGWSGEAVAYHVKIAAAAGWLDATIEQIPDADDVSVTYVDYSVHGLWMPGHDFLEYVRDDTHWGAVKRAAGKAGAVTAAAFGRIAERTAFERVDALLRGLGL